MGGSPPSNPRHERRRMALFASGGGDCKMKTFTGYDTPQERERTYWENREVERVKEWQARSAAWQARRWEEANKLDEAVKQATKEIDLDQRRKDRITVAVAMFIATLVFGFMGR